MAIRDKLKKTKRRGVYYREHPTRKLGINGVRKDHQYVLRYKVRMGDGISKEVVETFGWESDGYTEVDAEKKLQDLKSNAKSGKGPKTLAEERKENEIKKLAEADSLIEENKKNTTFDKYWSEHYYPDCERKKSKGSYLAEKSLYETWVRPVLGNIKIKDIMPFHIRKMKIKMEDEGRAPASIKYAYALISQVWSMARSDRYVAGDSPTKDKSCKPPKVDNERERFLTNDEAEKLLNALYLRSPDVADMSLLSLHGGLRASEAFKLTWQVVDFNRKELRFLDTKGKVRKSVPMTTDVYKMLSRRYQERERILSLADDLQSSEKKRKQLERQRKRFESSLVFPDTKGEQIETVSKTFDRVVKELGLNEGIEDRRHKFTFHGLRHSCASFLVQSGVPLYTVAKYLGHKTLKMTERYSHLKQDNLRDAMGQLESALKKKPGKPETEEKAQNK